MSWSEVCVLLGFYTAKMVDFSCVKSVGSILKSLDVLVCFEVMS